MSVEIRIGDAPDELRGSRMISSASPLTASAASHQIELPLFRSKDELERRVDYLLSILADRLWHTARDLKVYGFTDRELRELVENSDGRVLSFPGSPGYKIFEAATLQEFQQAEALRNQARRMLSRFFRYRRRYHRGT